MNTANLKTCALIAGSLILAGCGGGSGSDNNGSGDVSVAVTDAAVDGASSVVVEFTAVELKPNGGNSILFELDEPQQIDLLDVQGSEFEPLITSESVPAGKYNWIRLHINDNECDASGLTGNDPSGSYIVLSDSSVEPLHVPSGSQSGLKLNSGFTVAAGGQTDVTIDFDVRKSVTAPEGQDCHFLKPSLRLVDNAEVGHIAGTVDTTAYGERCPEGAAVYLFDEGVTADDIDGLDGEPITSAIVDELGDYEIGFVLAGNYNVALTCDGELDDPEADNSDVVTFDATKPAEVIVDQTTPIDF